MVCLLSERHHFQRITTKAVRRHFRRTCRISRRRAGAARSHARCGARGEAAPVSDRRPTSCSLSVHLELPPVAQLTLHQGHASLDAILEEETREVAVRSTHSGGRVA